MDTSRSVKLMTLTNNLVFRPGDEWMDVIEKKQIVLFSDKSECSGCSACENICSNRAINMETDENGFVYPVIDYSLCSNCGRCKKVCYYQSGEGKNLVESSYVSVLKNDEILMKSASGGLFAGIAQMILNDNGVVFGVALELEEEELTPSHIVIKDKSELVKIQGSKYVQSEIGTSYQKVKKYLMTGKKVLFSGTPCQVAGLKGFLGRKYDNLFTIDIICHGVPSANFFQDYIKVLSKKMKGNIVDFKFRDKKYGWGHNARIVYIDLDGKKHIKYIPSGSSSYFDMFLKSEICRENCYSCPYAGEYRPGDITLGDYWGVQEEHPELMLSAGGGYDDIKGISCVLVNTRQGVGLLNKITEEIKLNKSSFEKVARQNEQLKNPSKYPESRKLVLDIYRNKGYEAVEQFFKKRNGIRTQYYYLKNMFPRSLKGNIKKLLNRN